MSGFAIVRQTDRLYHRPRNITCRFNDDTNPWIPSTILPGVRVTIKIREEKRRGKERREWFRIGSLSARSTTRTLPFKDIQILAERYSKVNKYNPCSLVYLLRDLNVLPPIIETKRGFVVKKFDISIYKYFNFNLNIFQNWKPTDLLYFFIKECTCFSKTFI